MTSFTTTKQAHPDCTGCAEMAQSAEGIARATGSVGGTYGDGAHSATVERAQPPKVQYPTDVCADHEFGSDWPCKECGK